MNGLVVLNKPADISSAKAVSKVKKLVGAAKVGHTGTLDPFATGVLVCCIGQATRLARFFLHGNKTYEAVLQLGTETDTQDATGQIVSRAGVPDLERPQIESVFKTFKGKQMQHPPVYAALKHKGTPLYKLARQGKPVQKPPRAINISSLRVLDVNLPQIRFVVTCSGGTYIRTLCADIGRKMGSVGHLAKLHRTVSSGFNIDQAVSLETLLELKKQSRHNDVIIHMSAALKKMPAFIATGKVLECILQGKQISSELVPSSIIKLPENVEFEDYLKVVDGKNRLRAVLERAPSGARYNYCCVFH
ncbi:MAG: tRNA pseudouridine(55) synthase TruB [Desulfobacteraceae bacterium]|nr:tRNA pseudouridine(55) synthase TruB [Desulfobacteraceae bacterium]